MQQGEEVAKQKVILLVGSPDSGKSVVAGILAEEFGFQCISTRMLLYRYGGDNIRAIIENGGVVDDETTCPIVSRHLPMNAERLVIDTPRSANQVRMIRTNYPKTSLYTIHVTVDVDLILDRAKKRNRPDDAKIKDRLEKYSKYFAEMEGSLRTLTHVEELDNNGSLEKLQTRLSEICDQWGIGKLRTLTEAQLA